MAKEKLVPPRKLITNTIERVGREHGMRRVWEDWIEGMALAWANVLGNAAPRLQDDAWREREERYMRLVQRYGAEVWRELARLAQAFPDVLEELETGSPDGAAATRKHGWEGGGDPLGELYMTLDFGNERMGQFFTPWEICLLNARVILGSAEELAGEIEGKGWITIDDPACGSATHLLAACWVARERGVNPQRQVGFHGTDLSGVAAQMAYVNLAARGLPGMIVHGNSLTLQTFEVWRTPAWILGRWEQRLPRLQRVDEVELAQSVAPELAPDPPPEPARAKARRPREVPGQGSLF